MTDTLNTLRRELVALGGEEVFAGEIVARSEDGFKVSVPAVINYDREAERKRLYYIYVAWVTPRGKIKVRDWEPSFKRSGDALIANAAVDAISSISRNFGSLRPLTELRVGGKVWRRLKDRLPQNEFRNLLEQGRLFKSSLLGTWFVLKEE